MTAFHCLIASTQSELDDALRVRWAVAGAELSYAVHPGVPREIDCFDTLETTWHFVVYADGEPVATTRLLLPNAEVAQAHGHWLGIDLERKVDLSGMGRPGMRLAERTSSYVLPAWRDSEALARLHAALYEESRRLGLTHWIAAGAPGQGPGLTVLEEHLVAHRERRAA
jgi:predicted GNAT family N-acyltransferase